MDHIPSAAAYENLFSTVKNKQAYVPPKYISESGQFDFTAEHSLIPALPPKFKIKETDQIFSIGCCFMREIENSLNDQGYELLVTEFANESNKELGFQESSLLNMYHLGATMSRLKRSLSDNPYLVEEAAEPTGGGNWADLYLNENASPVNAELLIKRRYELNRLYHHLKEADLIVISLSLIEGWFDKQHGVYLTRPPSRNYCIKNPDRFEFRRLSYIDTVNYLSEMISLIKSRSKAKILFTISPVPPRATFLNEPILKSSFYQKSILRGAIDNVAAEHSDVDYFPSLEIFNYIGPSSYSDDYKQIKPSYITSFVKNILLRYVSD
jgi:hypothetical protein